MLSGSVEKTDQKTGLMMYLRGGTASDIGTVRKTNQDRICCELMNENSGSFGLGVICDGVGGSESGEVAATIVIKLASQWFHEVARWIQPSKESKQILFSHYIDAVENWNEEVYDYRKRENLATATTMSGIVLLENAYCLLHIGDSRIYRMNYDAQGKFCLAQLTVDEQVSRMKNGRMKAYLDNYVGKQRDPWYVRTDGIIEPDTLFLYCSDGFYHHLTLDDAKEIYSEAMNKEGNISSLLGRYIVKMEERGERDNISAGIICCQ